MSMKHNRTRAVFLEELIAKPVSDNAIVHKKFILPYLKEQLKILAAQEGRASWKRTDRMWETFLKEVDE